MSLLLDALKKAEQSKREAAAKTEQQGTMIADNPKTGLNKPTMSDPLLEDLALNSHLANESLEPTSTTDTKPVKDSATKVATAIEEFMPAAQDFSDNAVSAVLSRDALSLTPNERPTLARTTTQNFAFHESNKSASAAYPTLSLAIEKDKTHEAPKVASAPYRTEPQSQNERERRSAQAYVRNSPQRSMPNPPPEMQTLAPNKRFSQKFLLLLMLIIFLVVGIAVYFGMQFVSLLRPQATTMALASAPITKPILPPVTASAVDSAVSHQKSVLPENPKMQTSAAPDYGKIASQHKPAGMGTAASLGAPVKKTRAMTASTVPQQARSIPSSTGPNLATKLGAQASDTLQPQSPKLTIQSSKDERLVALQNAYLALNSNQIDLARQQFQRILEQEPNSSYSLRGMASVELLSNNKEKAAEYFQKALRINPLDTVALAGFMGLYGPSDSQAAISRLKTMIAAQPGQAPLEFALGNLQARNSNWSEAQLSYFNAYTADSNNPDYAFNLAASLDHLGKASLAARYYREALELAKVRAAGFDAAIVQARLQSLNE